MPYTTGEYVVKVNTFGRNSDVRLSWEGVRRLTELEVESLSLIHI